MTTYRTMKYSEFKDDGVYVDFSDNFYYYNAANKELYRLTPERKFAKEVESLFFKKHDGEVKISLPKKPSYHYNHEYDTAD